ncbi:MAG: type II toxin-antitoxin system RelE/ParE family toxin [Candidatus Moeniiplasma glomeromycotorum]|nr:type II toxin-antitoxin system RelE/ParE family toxin [Candidatus Moeniiplasma glomeromycotorum]MCE8167439.1 type II toxin-antitoxin system RelE/ParE family toxin [Candidatus Moeniiplasma glomeromycotorum]MCE8168547.1 type II toxin-antitoxin system RelE/ParE family toxin [Candidatus Moeniiplasma glomeromycotorum]
MLEIFPDTFKDETTRKIWERDFIKKGLSQEIQERAKVEMVLLFSTNYFPYLKQIFGKILKPLKGNRRGEYRIKVDNQYQICFKWKDGRPYEIEFNKHYWD